LELERLPKEMLEAKRKKNTQETFRGQYYEMKATAGLSSTRMLKGGKEIRKLFL
jgi:hypothetical protein